MPRFDPDTKRSRVLPLEARIRNLSRIFERLREVPESWLNGAKRSAGSNGNGGVSRSMEPIPCTDYTTLIQAWRRAMKWIDGLDRALCCGLASITSCRAVGDQLWFKIISPASTGKSDLCEAFSLNVRYVIAKSTIRGFHTGWQNTGGQDGEDFSLIAQIKDKTLVTKDGDTLLQSPNLGQILSEARDIYDAVSRSHYRNAQGKDYAGIRTTWILAGTSSLKAIDSSELGERFLDCVIMDRIDDELEDEILWRVTNRADRNMSIEATDDLSTHHDPDKLYAMRLTAGYIDYLRENATELLSSVDMSDRAKRLCTRYGKFVAYMRARPSKKQDELQEREMAARLTSQFTRLAKCTAVVLNRDTVDDDTLRRCRQVALDTARGPVLKIVKCLMERRSKDVSVPGLSKESLQLASGLAPEKTLDLLRFLRHIEVLDYVTIPNREGRWVLQPKIAKLYRQVVLGQEESLEEY